MNTAEIKKEIDRLNRTIEIYQARIYLMNVENWDLEDKYYRHDGRLWNQLMGLNRILKDYYMQRTEYKRLLNKIEEDNKLIEIPKRYKKSNNERLLFWSISEYGLTRGDKR